METKTKKKPFLAVDLLEALKEERLKQMEKLDAEILVEEKKLEKIVRINDLEVAAILLPGGADQKLIESSIKKLLEKRASLKERLKENGSVVLYSEIRMLAHRYALRFLPRDYYISDFPSGIQKDVRDCARKNELKFEALRAFILAPSKAFKLENKDPLLFVRDNYWAGNADDAKYYFVRQWGKEFTVLRRFISAASRFFYLRFSLYCLLWLFGVYMLGSQWEGSSDIVKLGLSIGHVVAVVSAILLMIRFGAHSEGDDTISLWYDRKLWNTPFK
jgi:hypothetical protein